MMMVGTGSRLDGRRHLPASNRAATRSLLRGSGRAAHTLVEGAIGLAIGAVILGIVLALLVQVTGSAGRTDDRLDPVEAGHLLLMKLRDSLADSFVYSIKDDGTRLTYRTPRGGAEIRYEPATGAVTYRKPGAAVPDPAVLRVKAFRLASRWQGCIAVRVAIARPVEGRGGEVPGTVTITDRIVIPCFAPSEPQAPWCCPRVLLGQR